jgi:hypothetical protein
LTEILENGGNKKATPSDGLLVLAGLAFLGSYQGRALAIIVVVC